MKLFPLILLLIKCSNAAVIDRQVDVLKGVSCEEDPLGEGYVVPDPHHCNR